jgi:hypothetical protein
VRTQSISVALGYFAGMLMLLSLLATSACGAQRGQFPPYPDNWEWTLSPEQRASLTDLDAALLDNGDVLMVARFTDRAGVRRERLSLLFPRKHIEVASIDAADRVTFRNGETALVIQHAQREADIGNGFTVSSISRSYRLCYRGPVRNLVVKRDKLRHAVLEKVVFALLEEPREFVGGGGQAWFGEEGASCPDEGPVRVQYRVAALAGIFLPLPDGTTLLVDKDAAVIVRLRDTLEPGRLSHSGRVYSFEYTGNDYFIDDVLHKKYGGDDSAQTPRYQEMLDDLYNYLNQLQREH